MGSSGSTSTTTNEPWSVQEPHLEDIYSEAGSLYTDYTAPYYPGDTVAGFDPAQTQALEGITDLASQPSALLSNASSSLAGTLSGDSYTSYLAGGGSPTASFDYLSSLYGTPTSGPITSQELASLGLSAAPQESDFMTTNRAGRERLNTGAYESALADWQSGTDASISGLLDYKNTNPLLSGAFSPTAALSPESKFLSSTASGGFLGSNPYLDAQYKSASQPIIDQYNQQILPGITSQFAQGGRSGASGAEGAMGSAIGLEGQVLGQSLGTLGANIYGPAYEAERDRMLSAAQLMGEGARAEAGLTSGAFESAAGRQLGAAEIQQEGELTGREIAVDATDALTKAAIIAPDVYRGQYLPYEYMYDAGSLYQDQAQAEIDADRERFDYITQRPYSELDYYSDIIQGGSDFSTSTTETEEDTDLLSLGLGSASTLGAGALIAFGSSRAIKDRVADEAGVLARIKALPVERWRYTGLHADGQEHIGPYAEDFQKTFGVGNGTHIHMADASGIAFLAIKELTERIEALEERTEDGSV